MQKIEASSPEAQSANITAENIAKLRALFPEVFTEGKDGAAINVDVLKGLVGAVVTDADEKYGLNWHGKRRARQLALTPSTGTLRPCQEESVDWDTTQNMMIEGDNLEVLKLLQKSYANKVKLIYIDPPYNTGKDFVYPDNFHDSIQNYLELTGQVEGGAKIGSNTDASGRFHTDWLNMLYPRLKLAHSLLRNDGVIFVSIADHEVHNLRAAMNEVFGEENFIAAVIWQKVFSPKNSARHFSEDHDYVIVYAKSAETWTPRLLPRTEEMEARYSNPDNDPRGVWTSGDLSARNFYGEGTYPVTSPSGRVIGGPPSGRYWVVSKPKFDEMNVDNRIWWGADGSNMPRFKRFLSDVQGGKVPQTLWTHEEVGNTQEAKKELLAAVSFPNSDVVFGTPKPTRLMRRILQLATSPDADDIVIDFFAGTGTTMDALYAQNAEDGGKRRCILVQLPEPMAGAESAGWTTIADVTKARIRGAGKRHRETDPMFAGDVGFRVFKLDTSNIRAWAPKREELERSLIDHLDHLDAGRTEADVLYELLLKLGLEATELAGADTVNLNESDIELPDVLTELQDRTQLTRRSIGRILTECRRLNDFKRNPQEFIQIAAEAINRCKRHALVDGIKYQRLGDEAFYAQALFEQTELKGYLENMLQDTAKSVYAHVVYDSDTERAFADQLEKNTAIKVYAKLPGWFRVPTPLGTYNPDWAVLVATPDGDKLYFVVETKSSLLVDDLRRIEADKIKCGAAHFKALAVGENPAVYGKFKDVAGLLGAVTT